MATTAQSIVAAWFVVNAIILLYLGWVRPVLRNAVEHCEAEYGMDRGGLIALTGVLILVFGVPFMLTVLYLGIRQIKEKGGEA